MEKVHSFFTLNIVWKLSALLLALIIWFFVMNTINPVERANFPLTLQIVNAGSIENNEFILVNREQLEIRQISVQVRAPRRVLDYLNQQRNDTLVAYIDLSPMDIFAEATLGQPTEVSVQYRFPDGVDYDLIRFSPTRVEVIVDRFETYYFPISIGQMIGAAEGHIAHQPQITPAEVAISGSRSNLLSIASVRVNVDLTDISEDIAFPANVMVLNHRGENINALFEIYPEETEVVVRVDMHRSIPVHAPPLNGVVADGFRIQSVDWSPRSIEVVGDAANINTVQSIQLPTIDVSGLDVNMHRIFDMREHFMHTPLSIKNGTPHEVAVTITLEQETVREMEFLASELYIEGMVYPFEFVYNTVLLTISGPASIVDAIDQAELRGNIMLTGIEPGEHIVPVHFDLPDDVQQLGEGPVIQIAVMDLTLEEEAPLVEDEEEEY